MSTNAFPGAMSAEVECDFELGVAHVLFIDTVDYPKWLLNEQRRVLETLKKIVRATRSFQDAKFGSRLRLKPCNLSDAAAQARRSASGQKHCRRSLKKHCCASIREPQRV
jgi:hypothetical protein